MTKVEKLAQASPVNGKETWACTEGTFKDMGALGTELFKLAGAS